MSVNGGNSVKMTPIKRLICRLVGQCGSQKDDDNALMMSNLLRRFDRIERDVQHEKERYYPVADYVRGGNHNHER
jgi:hypothetical protein